MRVFPHFRKPASTTRESPVLLPPVFLKKFFWRKATHCRCWLFPAKKRGGLCRWFCKLSKHQQPREEAGNKNK